MLSVIRANSHHHLPCQELAFFEPLLNRERIHRSIELTHFDQERELMTAIKKEAGRRRRATHIDRHLGPEEPSTSTQLLRCEEELEVSLPPPASFLFNNPTCNVADIRMQLDAHLILPIS